MTRSLSFVRTAKGPAPFSNSRQWRLLFGGSSILQSGLGLAVTCFLWFASPLSADDNIVDEKSEGKSQRQTDLLATSKRDYRQPVGLALLHQDRFIAVAHQKSGDVQLWDLSNKTQSSRCTLFPGLSAIEALNDEWFVVTNPLRAELYLLHSKDGAVQLVETLTTSHSPSRIEWNSATSQLLVACLWSRRIDTFRFDPPKEQSNGHLVKTGTKDLSIAPGILKTLPKELTNGRELLLVADAFGSSLQLIDIRSGEMVVSHPFLGHAICGVCVDGNEVGLTYAAINDFAETTENDIHWGVLLGNDYRTISIEALLHKKGEAIYQEGKFQPIGVPGNGAAELTSMRTTRNGKILATAGGTDQLAIGDRAKKRFRFVPVGRYPVSSVIAESTELAYVANKFDDSISIVDLKQAKLIDTIWMGPLRELDEAEKGELLFHDAALSHDRWMTCASCHVGGHTNGLLTDNLGDRTFGAPKRVISLLGNGNTQPFTWLGIDPDLHAQIRRSVDKTMQSYRKLDPEEVGQIAAYCQSLPAPPSVASARGTGNVDQIEKGRKIFARENCTDCHLPPTYTTPETYDVGIHDEKGAKRFNPPSLLGVSQRGPNYFHDNRAEGLHGVLVDHRHRLERPLTDEDRQALLAFLESL